MFLDSLVREGNEQISPASKVKSGRIGYVSRKPSLDPRQEATAHRPHREELSNFDSVLLVLYKLEYH